MKYRYKMVQIPPNIIVKQGDSANAAAQYLESATRDAANSGWEFYRVDSIGVMEEPGCLARIFGARSSRSEYYVITFRREAT